MQCGSGVDLSDVGRVNREPRRIVMFVLMFNPEKEIKKLLLQPRFPVRCCFDV